MDRRRWYPVLRSGVVHPRVNGQVRDREGSLFGTRAALHRQPVPPDVVVLPTAEADRSTLGRLLQLYVHDLSQFRETIVNREQLAASTR